MKCPKCSNPILEGSKFCNNCGIKLDYIEMECPICHAKDLTHSSKFCPNCGQPINYSGYRLSNFRNIEIEELKRCPICGSEDGYTDGDFYRCDACGEFYYIPGCPSCGSHKVADDFTNWRQYKCEDCGHTWGNPMKPLMMCKETTLDHKGNPIKNYFEFNGFILGLTPSDLVLERSGKNEYAPNQSIDMDGVSYYFKDNVLSKVTLQNRENLPTFYRSVGLCNKDIFVVANILEKGLGFSTHVADMNKYGRNYVVVDATLPLSTAYDRFLEIYFSRDVDYGEWISVDVRQLD